ncbi:synaptonemal complex central element protein 2 [Polymixia lowei]
MAQFFPAKSAPSCQSTPKPGHCLVMLAGKDPTEVQDVVMTQSLPGEDTWSSEIFDDGIGQHSEDSGVLLNISSISERDESPGSEMTAMEAAEAVSSKIEEIEKRTQDLIEWINRSRTADQEIITGFENKLLMSQACQQVREQMFASYEEHGHGMEDGLQELSEVLERSSQLSSELEDASQTLSAINTGLLQTPWL